MKPCSTERTVERPYSGPQLGPQPSTPAMRHAARTDDCQAEVVKALRAIGAAVYYLKLPLDLLVAIRRPGEEATRTMLVECKDEGCDLNANQREFWNSWPGEKHLVRGPMEAVNAVLGKEAMK